MPDYISFKDLNESIVKRIKTGDVFIYPTDTIYGLGCNAIIEESVNRIREIKKSDKPFSIIAPSKQWIYKNLEVKNKSYIKKLPGSYTFILKTKKEIIARNVNLGMKTLGVRIPNHDFTKFIKVPFVTTSVNLTGKKPITDIKNISRKILNKVDIVIDDGILDNKPSTVIDLTEKIPKILR